jgi:hypothetical protein
MNLNTKKIANPRPIVAVITTAAAPPASDTRPVANVCTELVLSSVIGLLIYGY